MDMKNGAMIDYDPGYIFEGIDSFFRGQTEDPRFGKLPELLDLFSFMESFVLHDFIGYIERVGSEASSVPEFIERAKNQGTICSIPVDGGQLVELVMECRKMWPTMYGQLSDDDLSVMFSLFLKSQAASEDIKTRRNQKRIERTEDHAPRSLVDTAANWMFGHDGLDAIRMGQGKMQFYLTDGANPVIDHSAHNYWLDQVSVIAAFARLNGLTYSPSVYNLPAFSILCHGTCHLGGLLYNELKSLLSSEITSLQRIGVPIEMPIPPIPAIILSRIRSVGDIYGELESLRDEFEPFRNKFRKYQDVISNPQGQTLGRVIQARRESLSEVETALAQVAKQRTDSRLVMETFDSVIKSSVEAHGLEIKTSFSLSGLVTLAAQRIKISIIKGRASSLFDLWKKTMQIKDYHHLVSRSLGYEITPVDVQAQIKYSTLVENQLATLRGRWDGFRAE